MKKVRPSALAALLATTELLLGGITPDVAQAAEAANWPLSVIGMTPTSMTAFNNDNVALDNCSNQGQPLSFEYFHEGYAASSLATSTSADGGVACGGDTALNTPDGTLYTMSSQPGGTTPTAMFAAMKNGHTLWQTDVSSDPGSCSSANGSHDAKMTFASQGSDGNIYGIVQSPSYGCAAYLAKVSNADGTILWKLPLTSDGSGKFNRDWVYGDHITTIDYTGKVRQFTYSGSENMAVSYQFPSSLGMLGSAYANAAGRIFAVGMCSGSVTDTVFAYFDPNGDNFSQASGLGCNPSVYYTPGANGNLVAYDYYGTVKTFSFTTTGITSSTTSVPEPSGVSNVFVYNYWQDSGGNAVVLRQLYGPSWSRIAVTADEIDGTTGTVINLLTVGVNSTHPSPSLKTGDVSPDGSALYMAICHDVSACPNSATTIDAWLHKVPLTGFGSPIKDANSFTTYTSATSKHNYVALGDSYSSGEGDMSYLAGTDQNGDFCHRSGLAYPELLEQNASLNLNMTAFAACSGATEDKILDSANVLNGELPQGVALSPDTNIVTMSIGGNDANFGGTLQTCTVRNTKTDAQNAANTPQTQVDQADCAQALSAVGTTLSAQSFTDNLTNLYNRVESAVPTAKLVIVGYPALFTSSSTLSSSCEWGTGPSDFAQLTSGRPVSSSEVSSIEGLTDQLDGDIITAIANTNNSNISFVDPRPLFAANALCTTNPWFNGAVFDLNLDYVAGSYHPNPSGQTAYESAVAAKVSTLTFP